MKLAQDVTLWMTNELHKMLTKVIMAKESYFNPYYILVTTRDNYLGPPAKRHNRLLNQGPEGEKTVDFSDKHVVHTTLVLLSKPPAVPLVNSSLWRIDNKIGEARCIYILPPDKPIILGTQMGKASKFIWKSAQGAPLIWSTN